MRGLSWGSWEGRHSPHAAFRITLVPSSGRAAAPGLKPLCLPRAPDDNASVLPPILHMYNETYICIMRPTNKTYTLTLSCQAEWSCTHFETLHETVEVADDGQVAVCCSVLQCVAVCCSVLQCVAVCCNVVQCDAVCFSVCCSVPHTLRHCMRLCVAVWCSVLQCVAVCSSMWQCIAVCCSVSTDSDKQSHADHRTSGWQCVAVCCGVLRCVAMCCSVLRCIAVCCGVLMCVAVCCSACVWQCVAVCRLTVCYADDRTAVCLRCAAVCCGALQCVVICGSV